MDSQAGIIGSYQQRITELERELDEMTTALAQAWDQLVPFLQEAPQLANSTQDLTPIIHAVMAASDTECGGIYLIQDNQWSGIPNLLELSADMRHQLRAATLTDNPIYHFSELDEAGSSLQWIFAPVKADDQIVGVIGIGSQEISHAFSAADHRILTRMAERVAGQIVAAQLARSREREAAALREMQIASMIQRSTQPTDAPRTPGVEFAPFWEPARHVGGDAWGWVQQSDGKLLWFILDVAGKGLPAAIAAVALHTAVRIGLRMGLNPVNLLEIINEEFYDAYTRTDLMATVAILSFDPNTSTYEQANAGHTPTLVRCGETWHLLKATAPPIGVLPELSVEAQILTLHPDDLIICYSDGFSEITTSNGLWGETGLMSAVRSSSKHAVAVAAEIVQAAREVSIHSEIQDDQTMVIVTLTEA